MPILLELSDATSLDLYVFFFLIIAVPVCLVALFIFVARKIIFWGIPKILDSRLLNNKFPKQ